MNLNRNKPTLLAFMVLLIAGCKTVTTGTGKKIPLFKGTIIYDVEVVKQVDNSFIKGDIHKFGTEMHLTVFRNGDIQKKYMGAPIDGYDLYYIDVKENVVMEKYNNSDSLYLHNASSQNLKKLTNLKLDKTKVTILEKELKQLAIAAHNKPSIDSKSEYVTIKYWYDEALKIDKNKYKQVNEDLFGYFLNASDGSLFLKYEIDYFKYKVIYTAREILPNKFEREKEKIDKTVPHIERQPTQ